MAGFFFGEKMIHEFEKQIESIRKELLETKDFEKYTEQMLMLLTEFHNYVENMTKSQLIKELTEYLIRKGKK